MALVLKDRVKVTTTTTGTGDFVIGGAQFGFRGFSGFVNGDTTYYTVVDQATGAWETGVGTYSISGPRLARTTVLDSSSAGGLVNFGVGPKDLFVAYPAGRAVSTAGNVTLTGPLSVPAGATGTQVPQAQEVALLASTYIGLRNLLINPLFNINQRGYVSGTNTSVANQYTVDRWRVVTLGQNLQLFANAPGFQALAPAGGIEQVVEGLNIHVYTHTLSWVGDATATVNGNPVANGGQVVLTPGTNATVKFSGGYVLSPQFEPGPRKTALWPRPVGLEVALCQRYFQAGITHTVTNVMPNALWHTLQTAMRVAPTVTATLVGGSGTGYSTYSVTPYGFRYSHSGAAGLADFSVTASAEL